MPSRADEGDRGVSGVGGGSDQRPRAPELRFQRRAEQIAEALRRKILDGDLADGDLLPKEEDLRSLYPVSKPTLREALRILEAEGLLSVQRGNVGGALVHRPTADNIAYTMALVLSSRRVALRDVAAALGELEPAGAALCAERPDRRTAVLPALRQTQEGARGSIDDLPTFRVSSQRFHEQMIRLAGNETLAMMAAAAEAVWSSHTRSYQSAPSEPAQLLEDRRRAMDDHERIIGLIAAGDSAGARQAMREHLVFVQAYMLDDHEPIDPTTLRRQLQG